MAPQQGLNKQKQKQTHHKHTNNASGQTKLGEAHNRLVSSISRHDTSHSMHQHILNIFKASFQDLLEPNAIEEKLDPKIQHLKHHLYHRNFQAAFGDSSLLRAYSARWCASRAMAYKDILDDVIQHYVRLPSLNTSQLVFNVVCIGGGGGAEYVGLAGLLDGAHDFDGSNDGKTHINACIVDTADWSLVLQQLHDSIENTRSQESNENSHLAYTAVEKNILVPDSVQSSPLQESVTSADLVTIFFTLNELFSDSIPKTQTFLMALTDVTRAGTVLVVVDSPGSYSTVKLGGKRGNTSSSPHDNQHATGEQKVRQYPMAWLLDHVLLKLCPQAHNTVRPFWRKLDSCDSRWFRVPKDLRYPIKLENMRYQLHVFARE